MKRKMIIVGVIIVLVIVFASGSFSNIKADTAVRDLSKDEAIQIALESNLQNLKLNTAIDTINRKITDYQELSKEAAELEKNFQKYQAAWRDAYSKSGSAIFYSDDKYAQLQQLKAAYTAAPAEQKPYIQAKYGYSEDQVNSLLQLWGAGLQLKEAKLVDDTLAPKELTNEQRYNTFVYPEIVPGVLAQDKHDKAILQQKVIKSAVDVKVNQGYDDILYAEDGYSLTEKLYEKQVKDFNETKLKYQAGVISELDRNLAEMQLEESKLKLDNLYRKVQNGKLQLKQSLGADLNTEFNYTDKTVSVGKPDTYESYLKSALESRAEISASNIDIQEKQTVFGLVQVYFSEGDLQYVQADQELQEAKLSHDEILKKIESEVQNLYLGVKQKQSAMLLADAKLKQAQSQYNSVKASYAAGLMPVSMLWNVELAVNQAEMNKSKALRDYSDALYLLEQNCKIGTEYIMEGEN